MGETSWSFAKRSWCCLQHSIGCPAISTAITAANDLGEKFEQLPPLRRTAQQPFGFASCMLAAMAASACVVAIMVAIVRRGRRGHSSIQESAAYSVQAEFLLSSSLG